MRGDRRAPKEALGKSPRVTGLTPRLIASWLFADRRLSNWALYLHVKSLASLLTTAADFCLQQFERDTKPLSGLFAPCKYLDFDRSTLSQ